MFELGSRGGGGGVLDVLVLGSTCGSPIAFPLSSTQSTWALLNYIELFKGLMGFCNLSLSKTPTPFPWQTRVIYDPKGKRS